MASAILRQLALMASLVLFAGGAGCAAQGDEPVEEDDDGTVDPTNDAEQAVSGLGIVPPTSIRGIRLGFTKRQVREILGKPQMITLADNEADTLFVYGGTIIQFWESSGRVRYVSTSSPGVRTKGGVGTGSLENAVDALTGSRCESEKEPNTAMWYQWCSIKGNGVRMEFWFNDAFGQPHDANSKIDRIILVPDSEPEGSRPGRP